jgi:8-oxo-dGTP pyrophosphatase MutT (NUDIX family)
MAKITCRFNDSVEALLRHVTVATLVLRDDKVLLTKRSPNLDEGGKWCLPGGYMDRDESLDEAAGREVYEETGW